jgi:Lipocalin-like domain
MKRILFFVSLAALTLISCKKDKDCETSTDSLSGNYRQTAIKYKQTPSSTEQDFFSTLDACEKDDILSLASNGTYNYQDAGTTCFPNGSYSGTWSYSGSTITVDGDAATIQSFDCSTLVIYITDAIVPGDRITTTLVKQ